MIHDAAEGVPSCYAELLEKELIIACVGALVSKGHMADWEVLPGFVSYHPHHGYRHGLGDGHPAYILCVPRSSAPICSHFPCPGSNPAQTVPVQLWMWC